MKQTFKAPFQLLDAGNAFVIFEFVYFIYNYINTRTIYNIAHMCGLVAQTIVLACITNIGSAGFVVPFAVYRRSVDWLYLLYEQVYVRILLYIQRWQLFVFKAWLLGEK